MAETLRSILREFKNLDAKIADHRTKDMFLLSSPGPISVIIACYLYFCIKIGPRFMENRKPYQPKTTLLLYNFVQIILSAYIVYEAMMGGWATEYNWFCQPIDKLKSPLNMRIISVVYIYYIAKLSELLDTLFFVMRKKNNQITFLHIYHHASMPILAWYGARYYPVGHGTLFGLLNSFVHVFMYTYYLISGLGPQYQKYLWWKKHITSMQMVQFIIVFFHNFFVLFSSCTYPKHLHVMLVLDSSLFFYLFGKFYIKSYKCKSDKPN